MSAPTARKSTPRKAAAKKAAPKTVERTDDERVEANVEQFEGFRERARSLKLGKNRVELEPYVITSDTFADGIDDDVVFRAPTDLRGKIAFQRASAAGDFPSLLEILGGAVALNRVINGFERYAEATGADAEEMFVGLCYTLINYFRGQGAADVPGGTHAS
ncbi:hypothetical protein [Gordonia amicalis]|uniref:hypothetical protein n=1 Tax=Gordonia amicalis TaxID=89053 RepID=UPI0024BAE137|nr:hypothetical protein [Gordonia amicalis]MDJ0454416.1 hypothetical protein [Gordonia amicalis]MDV7077695.1 hypothetical protein [Gordonia amicalis]